MDRPPVVVELCCGGIDDVLLAARLGISRIELNCGMPLGGLTPSVGLMRMARRAFSGVIIAMLRPREGGFCYSEAEFEQLLLDAHELRQSGADGFAAGFLTEHGHVDLRRCRAVRLSLPQVPLVFHRAFDVVPDQVAAMELLITERFDRILTSGGAVTAVDGAVEIAELIRRAGTRIEILAGGGIRAGRVRPLLLAGCQQIHTAVRTVIDDPSMGVPDVTGATGGRRTLHFGIPGAGRGSFGSASETELRNLLDELRN